MAEKIAKSRSSSKDHNQVIKTRCRKEQSELDSITVASSSKIIEVIDCDEKQKPSFLNE